MGEGYLYLITLGKIVSIDALNKEQFGAIVFISDESSSGCSGRTCGI